MQLASHHTVPLECLLCCSLAVMHAVSAAMFAGLMHVGFLSLCSPLKPNPTVLSTLFTYTPLTDPVKAVVVPRVSPPLTDPVSAVVAPVLNSVCDVQGLDAESLTALMASVNLHSRTAQTPDKTSPQQLSTQRNTHSDEADSPSQAGSNQQEAGQAAVPQPLSESAVGFASALSQGIVADCPLPFAELEADSIAATPARARRPARRAVPRSPEEAVRVGWLSMQGNDTCTHCCLA